MDPKDKIIFQQLDVIRTMTENNLRRIGEDFFGAPEEVRGDEPVAPPPAKAEQAPAPKQEAEAAPKEDIEALKAELNGYIGLERVKKEVSNLINMVTVHAMRKSHGLKTVDMSLHMVFTGNPGTGKTMMARLMARIYKSLGILSGGQLVEVDRSGLVAGYVGQTAIKTQEVISKAMGGVLFIDEAYALAGRSDNDFGQEAIDTLLKAMEDQREDLVVIVAGYDVLMERFIHSNPGLESRFNRYLQFEDYTLDEMMDILALQMDKGQYEMEAEAREAARESIRLATENTDTFGNARGVRNLFERILVAQANRLAAMEQLNKEDLMKIVPEDVLAARAMDEE